MMKRIRIAVPLIFVAAIGTWALTRNSDTADGALVASGTVEATDADLGFQMAGRLSELGPREGDRVTVGEELARLDSRELEARVAAARAQAGAAEARLADLRAGARPQEVATAEASLRAAEQRSDDARRDVERAQELFDGGAVSRQALDKANTSLQVSEEDVERARQNLELVREGPRLQTIEAQRAVVAQAHAQVSLTEATLSNAVISAPFSGIVTLRHREPGETVSPGAPVLTLLDPEDRWVRIYVREDQIGRVQLGLSARITSDTYPDRGYEGEVVFIGSEAEFTPRNVQTPEERIKLVYPVKIRITGDANFELKPGIPADVVLVSSGTGS
jgi:HlyD family secretion protein